MTNIDIINLEDCPLRVLKNQGQISKKRCVKHYCSFDKACRFSALYDIFCRIYLEKQTIGDK